MLLEMVEWLLKVAEGVLDKGVSGQSDYVLWPDCWTVKIQD